VTLPTRREVEYATFMTLGLVLLTVVPDTGRHGLSPLRWALVAVAAAALWVGFVWAHRRSRRRRRRELLGWRR
jgi:Flp pilus assembly protein TadB